MHNHFRYKGLQKENGFVDNKKMQNFAVTALMKARDIPDADVTLNVLLGNHALVISSKHRHIRYIVHTPAEEWAGCNCIWAQRGNICKHVVKVLLMLRPDIAEGTIARFCGKHVGTVIGGMREPLLRCFVIRNVILTLPPGRYPESNSGSDQCFVKGSWRSFEASSYRPL